MTTICKFPFAVGDTVRVFADRGMGPMMRLRLTQVRPFRIDGTDAEGRAWAVTWLSELNEQLYEVVGKKRSLVARYVRVFAEHKPDGPCSGTPNGGDRAASEPSHDDAEATKA